MVKEIHQEIELITSYLNPQEKDKVRHALKSVSYTHLTLPTIRTV